MPDPRPFFDFPNPSKFKWWSTCTVRILVVTDSTSGGFSATSGFHLGQVLAAIQNDPWSYVQFEFIKAHRDSGGEGVDKPNFKFDTEDLLKYSQIWLFGITRTGNELSQKELKALTQFMDAGGGVFATGDHENLGQAMCAQVPRVRSMRRWYYPNPGPNGEPVAPEQIGVTRHDTVVDLAAGGGQSDKTPQTIQPALYSRPLWWGRIAQFPHPVLCGPDGVIKHLPDHMHEGLCEVPADLSKIWTFDGQAFTEYPTSPGGTQVVPEVIAHARSRNTNNQEFGVLAAYDGHVANVGRVVVDATWHHWFNINLTGMIAATTVGDPTYDPSVIPQWEAIKAYYRNVALWLAKPSLQTCLRNSGWINILTYTDIIITVQPLKAVQHPLKYYWQLGVFARDAMGKLASRCQTVSWIYDFMTPDLVLVAKPWVQKPPFPVPPIPEPPLPDWVVWEDLENVVLGATIHRLMDTVRKGKSMQVAVKQLNERMDDVLLDGARLGMATYFEHHVSVGKLAASMLRQFQK
jgi:hypothetical protein